MNQIRKIIRASAGTGKTYRLSLEYIGILLQHRPEINFEEILVITFTKKATAEIKSRILDHLNQIRNNTTQGNEILNAIKIINPECRIDKGSMEYLDSVYRDMITNKYRIRIDTIDAFIYGIFKSLIAPYLGISKIAIDPNINDQLLPEILSRIMNSELLSNIKKIFQESRDRNLKNLEIFIYDLIKKRWILHFLHSEGSIKSADENLDPKKLLLDFSRQFGEVLKIFGEYFSLYIETKGYDTIPWQKFIQKDYFYILNSNMNLENMSLEEFILNFQRIISDEDLLKKHYQTILKDSHFWKGNILFRGEKNRESKERIIAAYELSRKKLILYLYYKYAIQEQEDILQLANSIYSIYDDLKFTRGLFTYDDITYYTYRYLYDPELSMIDSQGVMNLFYEFLSYNIRFILIDEFQDTSIMQWNILYPLISEVISGEGSKPYGGMIIVGDEKQSIYGWRGGERELLLKAYFFVKNPSGPEELDKTYRCGPVMTAFINKLFSNIAIDSARLSEPVYWDYHDVEGNSEEDPGFVEMIFQNLYLHDGSGNLLTRQDVYRKSIKTKLLPLLENNQIDPAKTVILARKNSELNEIAAILDEYSIDYILESSASLLHHRAVRPILFLLEFLAGDDIWDMLKFLRSDAILISPRFIKDLLKDYDKGRSWWQHLRKFDQDPIISRLIVLKKYSRKAKLLNLVKKIIADFNFPETFPEEIELKNINRFLQFIKEFEKHYAEYTLDLPGFLKFCRAAENKEEYSQLSLVESDSLKLLTIHKVKGLEFDTVFTFLNLQARFQRDISKLHLLHSFDEYYQKVTDYFLTYNYSELIKGGLKTELQIHKKRRDLVESLNTFYVTLTRSKKNLFVISYIKNKKDFPELFQEINSKEEFSLSDIIFRNLYQIAEKNIIQEDNGSYSSKIDSFHEVKKVTSAQDVIDLGNKQNDYFSERQSWMLNSKTPESRNFAKIYLEDKKILIGTIVHYYLSCIKYSSKPEFESALKKTIQKFGTLLSTEKIMELSRKVNTFIGNNTEYFSMNNWEQVYNEFTVFDDTGKEFRIDRLLVDHARKSILIIDYKTGYEYKQKQMDDYVSIIEELDFVRSNKYNVTGKFLVIDLDKIDRG